MVRQEVTDDLRRKLVGCLEHEADDPRRLFLSRDALGKFWNNEVENIMVLLKQPSTPENRGRLKSDFARIVCVLLRIGFRTEKYPKVFAKLLDPNTEGGVTDKSLPLPDADECAYWFGRTYAQEFCKEQHNLLEPIYIESSDLARYGEHRRLPFVGAPTSIGKGAFAEVFKVVIRRKYCRTAGDSNDEDKPLACKSFRNEQDLKIESQNNSYLQWNVLGHRNILVHRAAILHHQTFYIFMDLAPCGDLETLLSGGIRRDTLSVEVRHYDVNEMFPEATRRDVLKAFRDLAGALKFLHHDVKSDDNGESLRLAHNDLRPQNILIFPEPGQPIGRWKITDFGISTLGSKATSRPVLGDLIHRSPMQARERSMEGPNRAPEFSSTTYSRGHKADIWSLGTIFTEVLAFTRGFSQDDTTWSTWDSQVNTLRSVYGRSFYLTTSEARTSFRLKPDVREWLRALSLADAHLNECVGIVYLMLRPEPEAREDAEVVGDKLNRVISHMQHGQSYSHHFDLAREEKTTQPWCPILVQHQTAIPKELKTVSPDDEAKKLGKDDWKLKVTNYALLLVHRSSNKDKVVYVRPIETILPQNLLGQTFQLPGNVCWGTLGLSGLYGCVTGKHEYVHFNLETRQALTDDESNPQKELLQQAVPASNGMIALCSDKAIRLRSFSFDLDESITVRDDGKFRLVAFDDSGDKLFARISYSDPRHDTLAMWNVSLAQRPRLLAEFHVERPSQKVSRDDFHTIVPWANRIGGLMIYLHNGGGAIFTALTSGSSKGPLKAYHQHKSKRYPAKATMAATATKEHFMLVDTKGDVELYELGSSSGPDKLSLEYLGREEVPRMKKAAWVVLRRTSDDASRIGLQVIVHENDKDHLYDVDLGNKSQRWRLLKVN